MKYIMILVLLLIPMAANANKFPTTSLSADGVSAIATLPKSGGMWESTVIISGTFGGGAVTLGHSTSSSCASVNTIKDITGAIYQATAGDVVNVSLGLDKNNYTYLCATLSGSTSPSLTFNVYDNR